MATRGRVGRPPAGDSAETRRRILQAARARFARDGFRATTNRVIADDAGIAASALYHYFESKSDLYAAVYRDTIDHVYTEFEIVAGVHERLLERYAAVLRRACELQLSDPSITGFIVAVALETQRQPELLALIGPQRGRHTRFFSELVASAAAAGELRPDVDQVALADLLGSVLTGLARTAATAGDANRYIAAVGVLERFFGGTLLASPR